MELRPYQRDCLAAAHAAWRAGTRRVLVSLPTGGGKTVVFSRIPGFFQNSQTLFLAHREELLDQAAAKLAQSNPECSIAIEQAHRHAPPRANIIVASVATIGRTGSARLKKFNPASFGAIVVDEAHHATAPSYRIVFDHFRCFEPDGARLLGVTATPFRGDGSALGDVFETIAYQRSILDLIDDGWLCPVRAFSVKTQVAIDQVGTRGGDFKEQELADAIDTPERNTIVVDSWLRLSREFCRERSLFFCADVHHTYAIRDEIRRRGVHAEAVLGETPPDERKRILGAYGHGEISAVVNCGVLTEGYDNPGIDMVVMARPTKSPLLFSQAIGRGTRTSPGKQDLVVLDFVDNTKRHKIVTAASLFGMPAKLNLEGRDVREAKKKVDEIAGENPNLDLDLLDSMSDALKKAAELRDRLARERDAGPQVTAVDIFSRARAATPYSGLAWVQMPDGTFQLGLPDRTYVKIGQDLLGRFDAYHHPERVKLGEDSVIAGAFQIADRWVKSTYPDAIRLADRNAPWRLSGASDKQLDLLEQLTGKPQDRGKGRMSKGEASDRIATAFADNRAKRGSRITA